VNLKHSARTDIASIDAKSQPEAAKLLNVGRASVQRARKVAESGLQGYIDIGPCRENGSPLPYEAVFRSREAFLMVW